MNQMGTSNLADIENWTRRFLRMFFLHTCFAKVRLRAFNRLERSAIWGFSHTWRPRGATSGRIQLFA
jgi:hypothetical protein